MDILNKGKPAHRHARITRRIRTPLAALAVAVCMLSSSSSITVRTCANRIHFQGHLSGGGLSHA